MQLQVSWLPDHRCAAPSQDGTEPSQWQPAASLPGHSGEDRAGIAPVSLGLRAATYQTGNAPTWPHGSPLRSSQEEACELANRCHDTGPAPLHLLVPVILAAGLAPACGDDDEDDTSSTDASAATEAESTVKVTAVDYGFTGLPDSIEAGAHITMHNDSQAEVHELVAFEIPPEETRSAAELVALPENELFTHIFGEPSIVLVAPPGEDSIVAFGDGTLAPGRYLVVCSIPTGADVDEFMRQAQDPTAGPPNVPGGAPHFTAGMFTELLVE